MTNANSSKANRQVVAGIYLPLDVDTIQVHTITMQPATESRYVYLNKPITFLFYHDVKELQSYPKIRPKAYAMHIRDELNSKAT